MMTTTRIARAAWRSAPTAASDEQWLCASKPVGEAAQHMQVVRTREGVSKRSRLPHELERSGLRGTTRPSLACV